MKERKKIKIIKKERKKERKKENQNYWERKKERKKEKQGIEVKLSFESFLEAGENIFLLSFLSDINEVFNGELNEMEWNKNFL